MVAHGGGLEIRPEHIKAEDQVRYYMKEMPVNKQSK